MDDVQAGEKETAFIEAYVCNNIIAKIKRYKNGAIRTRTHNTIKYDCVYRISVHTRRTKKGTFMSNVGRIITLVVEIRDDVASAVIWDAMSLLDNSLLVAGCRPFIISNDNQIAERDKLEMIVERAMENSTDHSADDDYPEEIKTKCGKTFYWYPFNVYSSNFNNWCGTEWFSEIDELKKKYEVI